MYQKIFQTLQYKSFINMEYDHILISTVYNTNKKLNVSLSFWINKEGYFIFCFFYSWQIWTIKWGNLFYMLQFFLLLIFIYIYTVYKIKILMNNFCFDNKKKYKQTKNDLPHVNFNKKVLIICSINPNKFLIGYACTYNLSLFILNSNFYEMITDTEFFAQ